MAKFGGDASAINPQVPSDLVIDRSPTWREKAEPLLPWMTSGFHEEAQGAQEASELLGAPKTSWIQPKTNSQKFQMSLFCLSAETIHTDRKAFDSGIFLH